jgi:nucleosome assembly protein 1-like 1
MSLKLCRDINQMPEEVKDRFKAMKVLNDMVNDVCEEEQREHRALELKYEKLYQPVYAKRRALTSGEQDAVDEKLIALFNERVEIFRDEAFKQDVEIGPCDVKSIQNTPFGVCNFWLKAMCNNMSIAQQITEKDRPILEYLADISLDLHETGYGFELGFHFTKNPYFKNAVLKKSFPMKEENQVERAEGTVIEWTPGSDVTKQKKKKGKGKNKKTVVVKAQSFFNFFETVEKSADKEGGDDDDDSDGDEGDM